MKTKRSKNVLLVFMFMTLTVALSACSGDKEGEPSVSSQITIGIPQDLDSLDPHTAVAAGTEEVLFNVFEGLVKPDSDGNLYPAVASEYTISEDGITYTFTLREGVKFHDGSIVSVEDVKYSIERCADTENGEPLVAAFSNIASVNAVNDKTVEIKLMQPDTEFLASMTTAILKKGDQTQNQLVIGTGPYRMVSYTPQEKFVVEKFPEYWGEGAHIEQAVFKVCANADSIVMDLKGGSIDMFARVTAAQAAELADEFQILEGNMNLVQALYLNNNAAPFDDMRVRQALCYGADPQEIMLLTSDGKGTEIGSSMYPSFGKYYMEELKDVYEPDQEKAKALLAEAGYPDGFSFTMTVPSNYQQHVDTAQVLSEQFKKIGVDAKIELVEWSSWLSEVYTGRQYQSTVVGVDASELSAGALLGRFRSEAKNNFTNFNSKAYDVAYEKAATTMDDAEQTKYYKECETILAQEAANVYLQDIVELVALNKKFAGYEFYPLYVQDISQLYLVEE